MNDKSTFAVRLFVSGVVQGVGFRYYTLRIANDCGVFGFVRNLRDGRVEAYAEGKKENLQQFVSALKRGPSFASVSEIEEEWLTAGGRFETFDITY